MQQDRSRDTALPCWPLLHSCLSRLLEYRVLLEDIRPFVKRRQRTSLVKARYEQKSLFASSPQRYSAWEPPFVPERFLHLQFRSQHLPIYRNLSRLLDTCQRLASTSSTSPSKYASVYYGSVYESTSASTYQTEQTGHSHTLVDLCSQASLATRRKEQAFFRIASRNPAAHHRSGRRDAQCPSAAEFHGPEATLLR